MSKAGSIFIVLLAAALALHPVGAGAQSAVAQPRQTWQVFLQRKTGESHQLIFIDVLTGEETRVDVTGQRYTLAGSAVLYFDPSRNQVMLASPDGRVRPHPFIQPEGNTRRIDWLVSEDGTQLAWTLTNGSTFSSLTTLTTVAHLDGTNPRQVLVDGPRNGIRAAPVAFSVDNAVLYMDYQPDGVSDLTAFNQYAGLFALDLKTSATHYLPGEPGCFCGAGFGAGLFLRLALTTDLRGFDLKIYDLNEPFEQTIEALRLRNYTQAGDILISPDGAHAVYVLAQLRNFGAPDQSVETVVMLVDLDMMTQATLTEPIKTLVHPLAWTGDNSAVLFTSPQRDGTWKVNLSDGRLTKVAEATYLGTLSRGA